jgi:hypothetical protein
MKTATLITGATTGHLQVVLADHFDWPMGISGGRWPSATELTSNRHGSPRLRAARDDLRRAGEEAWIEINE